MDRASQRGMKGSLKKFDRKEHDIYDVKGKEAIINLAERVFKGKGFKTVENPNEHGIDVLTLNEKDEVIGCWEIEVRYGTWKGDISFPFDLINCIERKDHQWRREETFTSKIPFKLAKNYKVFYVQLNDECSRGVLIDGNVVLEHPLKPWANRKADGEYVRQVPISKTIQLKL